MLFSSAAPTPQEFLATFEDDRTTIESDDAYFKNYPTGGRKSTLNLYDETDAGTTYTNSYLLNGGYNSQVGLAKSFKVYPGDKIKITAKAKYTSTDDTPSNLTGFAAALLSAFGVPAPASGETTSVASALNNVGVVVAGGGDGESNGPPHAAVNMVVFDKKYNFVHGGFDQISTNAKQVGVSPVVNADLLSVEYTVTEEGFAFLYISNENATLVDVYFDDVMMSYTPGNIIQSNEYYPFGLQTASSWTRENATGNNFLANGGTELNSTSQLYDLDYRNYDPILGRMNQVDPMVDNYSSHSPYNFSYNNPVSMNDRNGADPRGDGYGDLDRIEWLEQRVAFSFIQEGGGTGGGSGYFGSLGNGYMFDMSDLWQSIRDRAEAGDENAIKYMGGQTYNSAGALITALSTQIGLGVANYYYDGKNSSDDMASMMAEVKWGLNNAPKWSMVASGGPGPFDSRFVRNLPDGRMEWKTIFGRTYIGDKDGNEEPDHFFSTLPGGSEFWDKTQMGIDIKEAFSFFNNVNNRELLGKAIEESIPWEKILNGVGIGIQFYRFSPVIPMIFIPPDTKPLQGTNPGPL